MAAPLIRTANLRLRPYRASDMEPLWAFFQSDRAQWVSPPSNRSHFWYGFASEVGSWELMGWGGWSIETADGQFAGQVAVTQPPHFAELELGWIMLDGFEGKGIAFEAATAARLWAFRDFEADTLVSYISRENTRSIALAERLGATRDDAAKRHDPDDLVYRHTPPEGLQ